MTTQHQQLSLSTKRLYLSKDRLFKHYLDCIILSGLTLFILFLISKVYITKNGNYNSPYFLLLFIIPLITFLAFVNKWRELQLQEIQTLLPKNDNYQAVKDTLKELGWHIKVDNKGFIEAYTDNFGFWTWTDQMVSILISDNKIAFNSIGNVDTYATQPFSWGQNSRNIKQFQETFEQLVKSQKS